MDIYIIQLLGKNIKLIHCIYILLYLLYFINIKKKKKHVFNWKRWLDRIKNLSKFL